MTDIIKKINKLEQDSLCLLDQLDAGLEQEEEVRLSLRNIIQKAFKFLSNNITYEEYDVIQTFLNSARGLLRVYFRDYVALPFKRPPIRTSKETEKILSIITQRSNLTDKSRFSDMSHYFDPATLGESSDEYVFSYNANIGNIHQNISSHRKISISEIFLKNSLIVEKSYRSFKSALDSEIEDGFKSYKDNYVNSCFDTSSYIIPAEGRKLC